MYGRGEASIAEQIGESKEVAIQLKEDVYKALPRLQKFEQELFDKVRKDGYVLTLYGYKRRLPEFLLPQYSLKYSDGKPVPSIFAEPIIRKYQNCRFNERAQFISDVYKKEDIIFEDNSQQKARASRQVVNSVIQGSASGMTKRSLINIYNNQELRDLRCYPLIPVHDEIIAVAPHRYAKPASELFIKTMEDAPKGVVDVHIKCDAEIYFNWAGKQVDLLPEILERN